MMRIIFILCWFTHYPCFAFSKRGCVKNFAGLSLNPVLSRRVTYPLFDTSIPPQACPQGDNLRIMSGAVFCDAVYSFQQRFFCVTILWLKTKQVEPDERGLAKTGCRAWRENAG
jgi:hypothetical protein